MDSKNNSCLKRRSELVKTNKIRLGLLSLTKNELNMKKKGVNDRFSFSSQAIKENLKHKPEEKEEKFILNKISLGSQKTSKDSSDISEVDSSSDMSCEEQEL